MLNKYLKVSSVLISDKPSKSGKVEVKVIACEKLGRTECPRCKHWSHTCRWHYNNYCDRCLKILLSLSASDLPNSKIEELQQKILENLNERGIDPKDLPDDLIHAQEHIWDYFYLKYQQRDQQQEDHFQDLKEEVSKYLTPEQL